MACAKYYVRLAHGCGVTALREMTGIDEQSVVGRDSMAAIALIDRLLLADPLADPAPGTSARLPVSERDALLAAIYTDTFGPVIQSEVRCEACGNLYEMDFALADIAGDLQRSRMRSQSELHGRLKATGSGSYLLDGAVRFRLPTGNDEIALLKSGASDPDAELLTRCIEADAPPDRADIEGVMAAIAPMLDLELKAVCPECRAVQLLGFRIQDFLLERLLGERVALRHQVHILAMNYRWPLDQILQLPRSDRIAYYQLILRDME